MQGNGESKIDKRKRLARAIRESGRCFICPPHGGENWGWNGDPDRRWLRDEGKSVKRKPKQTK